MNIKKLALVTGANRGIGLETVRQLAQQNFTVILCARDVCKGIAATKKLQLENLDVEFIQLDVADSNSIKLAAATVENKYGKLDALINNAAIFKDFGTPPSESNLKIVRETFETNTFGVWETIQLFLPLLRKSEAGRIVNVSSTAGSITKINSPDAPIFSVPDYQSSKTALNALTALFASELRNTKIKVNSVCPGGVNSNPPFTAKAPRTVEQGARISVAMAMLDESGVSGGFFDDNGVITW